MHIVRPQRLAEIQARNQGAGLREKKSQNLRGFPLQANPNSVFSQLQMEQVELEVCEKRRTSGLGILRLQGWVSLTAPRILAEARPPLSKTCAGMCPERKRDLPRIAPREKVATNVPVLLELYRGQPGPAVSQRRGRSLWFGAETERVGGNQILGRKMACESYEVYGC